jgi:hypothetical protein
MTEPYPTGTGTTDPGAGDRPNASIGELIGEVTADLSTLMRQEIELAKAEIKQEATKAGKAAGMLGAAGYAGHLTVVFLSLALMGLLMAWLPLGWSALIVAAVWAVVGAVLGVRGKRNLSTVNPKPQQTVETLKEDVQWAKHPTR